MKILRNIALASIAAVALSASLLAKPIPGPKGGKVVTSEAPHVEFFVAKDRTVVVSFYDKDLKPVAPAAQVVSAVAEAKSGKTSLKFAEKDGALVSTAPLPEGDGYRVVLQVRENAEAKPKNYRIEFHDEVCAECKHAEYACVCENSGDHGDHKH